MVNNGVPQHGLKDFTNLRDKTNMFIDLHSLVDQLYHCTYSWI